MLGPALAVNLDVYRPTVEQLRILWRARRSTLSIHGAGSLTMTGVSKADRLLRAILNTAVDDGLIRRNPCRIKGAGDEHSPERPVLSVAQVFALADAVGPRYREHQRAGGRRSRQRCRA